MDLRSQLEFVRKQQELRRLSHRKLIAERKMSAEAAQKVFEGFDQVAGTLEKLILLEEISEEMKVLASGLHV